MTEGAGGVMDQRRHEEDQYYIKLYLEQVAADTELSQIVRSDKRKDYWSWDSFHMSVAFLAAKQSKDPRTKVGACIVNSEKKIVGIGHNALPESRGWDQNDFPYWEKRDIEQDGFENTKYAYVCHAAINAVLNKNAENLKGCVLFTTLFPGHEDAQVIIQAGITKVVYFDDKYHDRRFSQIAKKLFLKAKVDCERYKSTPYYSDALPTIDVFPLPPSSLGGKVCPEYHNCLAGSTNYSEYMSNEDFFMTMACLAARRSKDPSRQVGACIVNKEGKIVGVGYNGFPLRVCDDDPDMTWGKVGASLDPSKVKYPYVVHAEVNAIMHKTCIDLKDCTLYVTLFPCNECAKVIVQAGTETIYYLMDDQHDRLYSKASRQLLKIAGYDIITDFIVKPARGKKICQRYIPSQRWAIPNVDLDTCTLPLFRRWVPSTHPKHVV